MREKSNKTVCCLGVFLGLGVLLLAAGVAIFFALDGFIREEVKEKVIIRPSSEVYDVWQAVPIPVYMQFYMFNTTNSDEVVNGEKPDVMQMGPYTYREYRVKYDIVWNSNGTVTYKQNRTFHFQRDMSVGKDSDLITTINPLMAVIVENFKFMPDFVKVIVSNVLEGLMGEKMFTQRPVRELLFGYDDPALIELKKFLPLWFKTTRIGYFIRRNYTDDGIYTVHTGASDISQLGIISEYNGQDHLDIWTTEWANLVNGSDGTLGPPFRFDAKFSPIFVSDICRSIRGIFQKHVDVKGIKLRRYGGDQYDMANATVNPDNIGFCVPQTNCLPTGLLNSSLCQKTVDSFHIPVVFSFPHFLYADPRVQDSVSGLDPVKDEHQTTTDTEPWTGLVLQVAKRLQINMFVESVPGIKQTGNIRRLFYPVLWLNESSVTDDKHANMLKDQLFIPKKVAEVGRVVAVTVGSIMVLVTGVLLVRHRMAVNRSRDNKKRAGAAVDDPSVNVSNGGVVSGSPRGDSNRLYSDPVDDTVAHSTVWRTPSQESAGLLKPQHRM